MLTLYFSMSSVILGGISNMIFCKTSVYKKYRVPIDMGKTLSDGKRIFGNNKTIIGFFTMIAFTIFYQILLGILDKHLGISELYNVYENTLQYNIIVGALMGFAYMICELPNSFIKRRLNIEDGATNKGINFLIDQLDSVIGVSIVIYIVSRITVWRMFQYIFIGTLTHIVVNVILRAVKIRKNI